MNILKFFGAGGNKYPKNPYREGTQRHRIYQAFVSRGGELYIHELVTPTSLGGLGVARYGARMFEMRNDLIELGLYIETDEPNFRYLLKQL
jgi:hypothetical protein